MNRRVLLVDDEPRVLDGYRRTLRRQFDIATAPGGRVALERLASEEPFAIVVSDYRMPEMNGVELLNEVRRTVPNTVRMMLTGQADMAATMAAINESDVFRFLAKPCEPERLAAALTAGVEQFRLVEAERELLEHTLRKTVEALVDVLGLVDQATHRESMHLRDRVAALCRTLGLDNTWEFEVAAMLSQLGVIALPADAVDRYRRGVTLAPGDRVMMDQHPHSAYNLLVKIPRLERISRMVLAQLRPPGSRPLDPEAPDDDDMVAMGAHLLDVAVSYERLTARGATAAAAVAQMRQRPGPPFRLRLLDALEGIDAARHDLVPKRLRLGELQPGMLLDQQVETTDGVMLLAPGAAITEAHIQRMQRFAASTGIREPIAVLVAPA